MKTTAPEKKSLLAHLSQIPDPRIEKKCAHKLSDIIAITICAVICGADDWNAIEYFGKIKASWFSKFLDLPNGIPSHDTFRRFFSMLSPLSFQAFFTDWVKDVAEQVKGVIAIDGKTLRRSHDSKLGKKAIHMVSAWSSENRMVLGQVKTDEKSNEITAIPKLLKILSLKNCIVTIDAMGCQKSIASQVINEGGDYLLALKGNQGTLSKQVEKAFTDADLASYEGMEFDFHEVREKSRDRHELRRHWTLNVSDLDVNVEGWRNLSIIGMIESQRTIKNKTTVEYRYYISSIEHSAEHFANAARSHWGIENSLHWQLDMSFREDESRMRKEHSAENFSVIRHVALNMLKCEQGRKLGIKNKRLNAGWDESYLAKVLACG